MHDMWLDVLQFSVRHPFCAVLVLKTVSGAFAYCTMQTLKTVTLMAMCFVAAGMIYSAASCIVSRRSKGLAACP